MSQLESDAGSDDDDMVATAREKMKVYYAFQASVVIQTVCAVAEPIVIGFAPLGSGIHAQIALLAFSTVLYLSLLIATFFFLDESAPLSTRILSLFDSEVIFETCCLCIGWACIMENPGIASLRCFRVFRMLWFFELVDQAAKTDPDYRPEDHMVSMAKNCSLCVRYLEAIGCELFTAKSKGGIVLLAIYFYVTYIFAAIFWIDERDLDTPMDINPTTGNTTLCATLTGCYITLMRLTLYDGTGFDFMGYTIATRSAGLSLLLFLYFCFSSLILLNGLIGVFGSAFAADDPDGAANKAILGSVKKCDSPAELVGAIENMMSDMRSFQSRVINDIAALNNKVMHLQQLALDADNAARALSDVTSETEEAIRPPMPRLVALPLHRGQKDVASDASHKGQMS